MEDLIGVYGILDLDHWPNAPFLLLDGGVEKRWKEPYAFHNTDRGTYSGWLMQYTLSGTGWFEKNGKTYEMRPGRGFLCQIPENSRYYLHPESEEPWIFLYFHFRGSAVSYAAERLFEKTGDVFYADADSEPIRTALQMHRKLKNGYRSEPYECGVFLYQFFCSLLREVQRPERKQTHFFVREAIRQMDTDCASVQGIEQLAEGTRTLKDSLADGAKQIQDTNKGEDTADMFAAPVETKETQITRVENNGHAMAPYMMSVALWVGCIAFSLMYPLTKYSGKLKSGLTWWGSKASVLYLIALLQAAVMIFMLHLCDGFEPVEMGKTLAVACLASVAFMSVMYFFTNTFGKVGSFLMLDFYGHSACRFRRDISSGIIRQLCTISP